MILVSVIVPIYNAEKYLERCLGSLVRQTLDEIEIIAIDDGSTDKSGEIISCFQNNYPNKIRGYYQNNSGISVTRNRGIDLAKGEYIAFIDSDDSVALNFCEIMVSAIEELHVDMVVCDYYETDGKNKKEKRIPGYNGNTVFERPEMLFDINTSPWNKLYNKRFLVSNNIYFPLELKYEDAVFLQRILAREAKVGSVAIPLVYYLVHFGSETTVVKETVFDIFGILHIICEEYNKKTREKYEKIHDYLEYFSVNRITVYNLQQMFQEKPELVNEFIDKGFEFLDQNFPKWRHNMYFNHNNNFIKRMIKKHKCVTKLVVKILRKKYETEVKNER